MENYRKVKVVGKGSFGYALLVQSVADRKLYIMKIIDVSQMDSKQKEEALNEVHVLKAMRHPYIVTYRESFMDKRNLCIVMDYADGGDMYRKIAKQKAIGKGFPENMILDWFVQICLAIKHIHDHKILHRDLKTQNVFLTSKGEVKIGDFGIARVLQHTYDCAQTAIGTPYYLSPEICQERPYNQKSDIWSIGCLLYEMVTLRHAFDSHNIKGLVVKILRGNYPAIPSCYSQNLRSLIDELLQKDPQKRPSVKKILEKDFLKSRISHLLSQTVARHEFGKSFLEPNAKEEQAPERPSERKFDRSSEQKPPERLSERQGERQPLRRVEPPIEERKQSGRVTPVRRLNNNYVSEAKENRKRQGYKAVVSSLQQCLQPAQPQEEECFEEAEEQRTKAHFLTPEGAPLPGVSALDSAFGRIEALRCYLEGMLGFEKFMQAYNYVMDMPDDDEGWLTSFLGRQHAKFVPLIFQLTTCEDAYFTASN